MRINKLSLSEAGVDQMYTKIKDMFENYSKYLEQLDYRKYEIEKGEDIYNFYLVMLEKTKELKNQLR